MGFPDDCEVVVKQTDHENWEVRVPINYSGRTQQFTVPIGSKTDFASVPRIFIWFLPRYGLYTKAAILHDYLWRERAKKGHLSWRDADGMFRRAMRELEVPFLRRWIMWGAVRLVSAIKLRRPRDILEWFLTLPGAAFFVILAVPFVAPAAVPILLGLAAFWVLEAVVYVPLKAIELAQRLVGRRKAKPVHAPTFEFNLARGKLRR